MCTLNKDADVMSFLKDWTDLANWTDGESSNAFDSGQCSPGSWIDLCDLSSLGLQAESPDHKEAAKSKQLIVPRALSQAPSQHTKNRLVRVAGELTEDRPTFPLDFVPTIPFEDRPIVPVQGRGPTIPVEDRPAILEQLSNVFASG